MPEGGHIKSHPHLRAQSRCVDRLEGLDSPGRELPERVGERIPGRGASVFARDHLVDPPQPCHGVREADCREGEQADVADLFGGHVLGQRPASVRPYGTLCLRADRHPELDEAGAASIERAALVAGLRQPLVGDVDVRKARSKCW